MMRTRLIALAVLLVGCGDSLLVCAQRGCEGGLTVRLAGYTGGGYRLEARTGPLAEPIVFECATYCETAFLPHFMAKNFSLRIIRPAAAATEYAYSDVRYDPVYLNGRDCGVTCERAEVAAEF